MEEMNLSRNASLPREILIAMYSLIGRLRNARAILLSDANQTVTTWMEEPSMVMLPLLQEDLLMEMPTFIGVSSNFEY